MQALRTPAVDVALTKAWAILSRGSGGCALRYISVFCAAVALVTSTSARGAEPQLVDPGQLSSPMHESGGSFTSDGRQVVFALRAGPYYRSTIVIGTRKGRTWTFKAAPFSGGLDYDTDPFILPNGRAIYFSSNRNPVGGVAKADFDIWRAFRTPTGWTEPQLVQAVNSPANETSPVVSETGVLYFSSRRTGRGDIYIAEPTDDGFASASPIGDAVNSPTPETSVAIDPREQTLVFSASSRADELLVEGTPYGRGDLYVSHKGPSGWSPAKRLDRPVNTEAAETNPAFSPDGRWLYFTSERSYALDTSKPLSHAQLKARLRKPRNGLGDLYRVPTKVLEQKR